MVILIFLLVTMVQISSNIGAFTSIFGPLDAIQVLQKNLKDNDASAGRPDNEQLDFSLRLEQREIEAEFYWSEGALPSLQTRTMSMQFPTAALDQRNCTSRTIRSATTHLRVLAREGRISWDEFHLETRQAHMPRRSSSRSGQDTAHASAILYWVCFNIRSHHHILLILCGWAHWIRLSMPYLDAHIPHMAHKPMP
jgi:hypothetical protein